MNKDDGVALEYRFRMVAAEVNPPAEALVYLLNMAATGPRRQRQKIMVADVSAAYFFAITTEIHVQLLEEDAETAEDGDPLCGRLNLNMHGTRDAAKNWMKEIEKLLKSFGSCDSFPILACI